MLMFPTRNASLDARGAAMLDRANPAGVGPVAPQRPSLFLVRKVVLEALSGRAAVDLFIRQVRSEEHTSELQSLMRISYAVFCLKIKNNKHHPTKHPTNYP